MHYYPYYSERRFVLKTATASGCATYPWLMPFVRSNTAARCRVFVFMVKVLL